MQSLTQLYTFQKIIKRKTKLPDPQTTKMNSANSQGPTDDFSSGVDFYKDKKDSLLLT